jgi:Fe-S-cluster-containing hydrogenase component 2
MTENTLKKLTPAPAPVQTLLLICEKCGKKQALEGEENPSIQIQRQLKSRIKETLKPGMARAITTSCMNICPVNAIAIGYLDSLQQNTSAQFFLLNEKDTNQAATDLFQQFCLKI